MSSVLLIDDDAVSRQLFTLLLSASGYRVTSAEDGTAALTLLASTSQPDSILCDLRMPGLAGYELTRRLRALAPHSTLIAMSATAPTAEQSAGFDAFLLKPFDAAAFTAALTKSASRTVRAAVTPDLDDAVFARLSAAMPPAELARLFALALSDTRSRVASIESAIAADDLATVQSQAHAIKGSAAMLGARALVAAAAALESTGNPSDARTQLAQILASAVRLEGILSSRTPRTP